MEEGPEPQEWVERTVEHHHHEQEPEGGVGTIAPALTAAVLAVLAALGSLLSGHAANEALVLQTRATDQWSYYQAKSTKEQIYDVSRQIVLALAEARGAERSEKTRSALDRFRSHVEQYEREKEEIRRKAEELEAESEHQFHRHHQFATGIAVLQVSIVLASITILVRRRALLVASLAGGVIGVVFLALGLLG
jgi:Domain of unknown function (DUF4337)